MVKLYKFGCGCIGLTDELLIKPCNDKMDILWGPGYIMDRNKASIQISDDEATNIMLELRRLISDGYRFRDIQNRLH